MNCEELKASVLSWIGQEIECRPTAPDCLSVTLPLLKPNGDAIELGIEPMGGNRWKLSDLGETYATLYLAGVDLYEEYVRAEEFRQIMRAHRITDEEQELLLETSSSELASSVFDFAHALQSMLALQFTLQPRQPKRDFASIVAKFFAEQRTSFDVPAEYIEGKTGKWKFSFVLNHIKTETLVKAVSATSRTQAMRSAEQSVFEIVDVREIRDSEAIIITDDEGARQAFWQPSIFRIFDGYKIPAYAFQSDHQKLTALAKRYALPA